MSPRTRVCLLALALALAGCAHPLAEFEPFPCSSEDTCPEPFFCVAGQCQSEPPPAGRDASAPGRDAATKEPDAAAPMDAATPPDAGPLPPDIGWSMDAAVARDAAAVTPDASSGPDAGASYPDTGPLNWMQLTVQGSDPLHAVHGQTANDYYAVATLKLVHHDGSNFQDVLFFTNGREGRSVWTVGQAVFTGGKEFLLRCSSNCTKALDHTLTPLSQVEFTGVCGRTLDSVFAVGWDNSTSPAAGLIYKVNMGTNNWDPHARVPGLNLQACWVDPNEVLYVVGKATGVNPPQVFRVEGSTLVPEPVTFGAIAPEQVTFQTIWGNASRVYIGASRKAIFSKAVGTTQWSVEYEPLGIGDVYAITGAGTDLLAGGEMHSAGNNQLLEYVGGQWGYATVRPALTVLGLWSAGPNVHFAVGKNASGVGVAFRSFR